MIAISFWTFINIQCNAGISTNVHHFLRILISFIGQFQASVMSATRTYTFRLFIIKFLWFQVVSTTFFALIWNKILVHITRAFQCIVIGFVLGQRISAP